MNLGVKVLIGFTVVLIFFGGPFILKLTPTTPSPVFFPTKISPTTGIDAISEFSLVAGTKVPRKLTVFPLSTYPSNKIETAGPNAKASSIFKMFSLEFDFISKISKRIPSPLRVSAIHCNEANVNNCAKAGTFETLKSLIIKFESELSLEIIDS